MSNDKIEKKINIIKKLREKKLESARVNSTNSLPATWNRDKKVRLLKEELRKKNQS
jgi:hypothetical protein